MEQAIIVLKDYLAELDHEMFQLLSQEDINTNHVAFVSREQHIVSKCIARLEAEVD